MSIIFDLGPDEKHLAPLLELPETKKFVALLSAHHVSMLVANTIEDMNGNDLGVIARDLAFVHSKTKDYEQRIRESRSLIRTRAAGAIFCIERVLEDAIGCRGHIAAAGLDDPRPFLLPLVAVETTLYPAIDEIDSDAPWMTSRRKMQIAETAIAEAYTYCGDLKRVAHQLRVEAMLMGKEFHYLDAAHRSRLPNPPAVLPSGQPEKSHLPSGNGIVEPFGFRWDGKEYQFPREERRRFDLLKAIWPTITRRSLKLSEVNDLLGRKLADGTIVDYSRELTEILASECGFPHAFKRDGDFLIYERHAC